MTKVLFNGEWQAEAKISLLSEAVQYGYGLFETMRTYEQKSLPFADRHIARLNRSAGQLGLPLSYSSDEIKAMLAKVVASETAELQRLKMMLLPEGLAIYSTAMNLPNSNKTIVVQTKQQQRVLPEHKSTAYLDCYLAWREAQEKGFDDTLFLTSDDYVLEASRANVFCINGDVIATPDTGVLRGIMREILLELEPGIQCQEISKPELINSDGVFITNSIVGMQSVAAIDGKKLGDLTNNSAYTTLKHKLATHTHDLMNGLVNS